MAAITQFRARVYVVTAATEVAIEIVGHEGLGVYVSQIGEPTQIRFSAPNFDGRYSTGGTYAGLLSASPETKYVRVDLVDEIAGTTTTIARGLLQAPQASDGGNPVYQVAAVGALNKLNKAEVELQPLTDPTAAQVVRHLCDWAGLSVDTSGLTAKQYSGIFDFVGINPLAELKELVLLARGARIRENPATGGLVVLDAPAMSAAVATLARGGGWLLSCAPKRGQQRPITCQQVTGDMPRAGVTTVTLDPPTTYAIDAAGKYRQADDTIRIQRFVSGRLESQHDIAQAITGVVRGLASWTLLQQAFTTDGHIHHSLTTTWTRVGGKLLLTGQVLTEWAHDADGYPSHKSVRTWAISGGKLRETARVLTAYAFDVVRKQGPDQIHGTATVDTWGISGGKLRQTAGQVDDLTSVPDTTATLGAVDKAEGGWCTTDAAVLAAWGEIYGAKIHTRWAQDADACDEIGEREVLRSLYKLDAVEVRTYYDPLIALGSTVLVADSEVEVPANNYYVEAINVDLVAGDAKMALPLLLPAVA